MTKQERLVKMWGVFCIGLFVITLFAIGCFLLTPHSKYFFEGVIAGCLLFWLASWALDKMFND